MICLATDNQSTLFIAESNTKESDKFSAKSLSNEDISEFKLEPDDFYDSMVAVSEQIENNSVSSELSQNVEIFGENVSGSYYYKL